HRRAVVSETRGRAGADDLTRLTPDISEPVWKLTCEVVCFPGTEDARSSSNRELHATTYHHTTFLAPMDDHLVTGASSRSITLMQDGKLPSRPLCGDQAQ